MSLPQSVPATTEKQHCPLGRDSIRMRPHGELTHVHPKHSCVHLISLGICTYIKKIGPTCHVHESVFKSCNPKKLISLNVQFIDVKM